MHALRKPRRSPRLRNHRTGYHFFLHKEITALPCQPLSSPRNMGDLDRWRQQLAQEADSDDEDGGVPGADDVYQPPDADLGLALEEMPLPSRVPHMPPRAGQGPPISTGRSRLSAIEEAPGGGGGGESRDFLLHKLKVAELKLEERDIELEAARQQVNGAPAGLTDAREAKMKELAKRAKAATMALGRERAKCAQLTAEVAQLKREGGSGGGAGGNGGGAAGGGGGGSNSAAARLAEAHGRVSDERNGLDPDARERELKESKDRLAAANARLHEAKVACQSSKAELVRYQRALAKEVGDEIPLAKLLDEASGAKGRAQQISLLKEQVKGLTRRLTSMNNEAESASGEGEVPPTPSVLDGADDRQRGAINAIEQDRRREHERALLREQELTTELNESRKKLEAMGARIRNLEADVKGKKDRLKIMIEKSDSDDQLVAALRTELDKARKGGGARGGGGGAGSGPSSIDHERRANELASRVAQQQTQIDRQEQIINALKDQRQQQQPQQPQHGGDGMRSRPGSSGRQPQDMIQLQSENGKLRELCQLLQEKLSEAQMREDDY